MVLLQKHHSSITPKILHHSTCNIERHILDICFWSFLLVSFGHLPKKYVFFQRVAYRFAWHEGFIHTSNEYSEMNSEGLIEHDHPSKAHEGLRFSFKFPTFHSKPHTILSSSESRWCSLPHILLPFHTCLFGTSLDVTIVGLISVEYCRINLV